VFNVQADFHTMTPRALFHPARLARRPVLSTQSDERLVDLVRAGSDPAFEAIVERYRRALMRYVSRLLPAERAEDVVQQAFVKAYEAMHRDTADLNLRPWLYRIAHNGAVNALRDRALGHAELDERMDGVERPEQALERRMGLHELVLAVQALPERQRSAILLRELEGRSYSEIAAELGVTDGAVRQLLNRARNSLRAAAAALVPLPLVTRLAAGDSTEPIAARVAELTGAGGGALAIKLCATALVTSAVVGGAAVAPDVGRDQSGGEPMGAAAAEAADESDDEEKGFRGSPLEDHGTARGDTSEDGADRGGVGPGRHSGRGDGSSERSGSGRDGDDGGRRGEEVSGDGGGGPSGGDRSSPSGGDRSGPSGGDPTELRDGGDRGGPGGGDTATTTDDHSGPGGGTEPLPEPEEVLDGSSGPGSGSSGGTTLESEELDSSGSGTSSGPG
jgi:RNA polymerase sigma factor (sigma-70 family)